MAEPQRPGQHEKQQSKRLASVHTAEDAAHQTGPDFRLLVPHLTSGKPDLNRVILHGLPALLQDWLLLGDVVWASR